MKISHNGEEWHGTFGVVLTAMIDDLLSDGAPVKVAVTAVDDHYTFVRTVVEHDAEHALLIFSDGTRVETENVGALEVL